MACQTPVLTITQHVTRICTLYFRIFKKYHYYHITISIKSTAGV